ncbi:hypothetical protein D9M68_487010 [compost metagenome]
MRALAHLLFHHALRQLQLRGALALERRIVARITLELAFVDVDDDVHYAIQEIAVVGDHDERARIALEPVFEPDNGIEVQVIGGLVQQQQVGRAHQRLRQVQAHPPSAGKAGQRQVHLRLREAQAGQQLFGARVHGVGVGIGERGVDVGHAQAVLCAFGFGLQRRQFGFQPAQRDVAVDGVLDRGTVQRRGFLRNVGHAPVGREVQVALVRVQRTAQQPEQAGFAGAVGADQADLVAGVQKQVDFVEQRLDAARE